MKLVFCPMFFARFQFYLNEYLVRKCFEQTCRINTKLHNIILNVLIVRTVVSLSRLHICTGLQ